VIERISLRDRVFRDLILRAGQSIQFGKQILISTESAHFPEHLARKVAAERTKMVGAVGFESTASPCEAGHTASIKVLV
jgi:hypothetical protein